MMDLILTSLFFGVLITIAVTKKVHNVFQEKSIIKEIRRTINLFIMWFLFNEKCICGKYNNKREGIRCSLCSDNFKVFPEILARFFRIYL